MKLIAQSENIENFSSNNYIYVDKTEYLYNLINNYERVFFSRPRRFGKSLTLNSIRTLFEKGVDPYFKGTWIYDKWNQNRYPVLHFSFLKYPTTNVKEFNHSICQTLRDFASRLNISSYTDDAKFTNLIRNIFSAMPYEMKIVVLIDEYDCQLSANINNPKLYEEFRLLLRDLYAVLKGEKHIKFLAVTGVTRLKDVSIFSVGSDIKDLSYHHAYSKMIGFTRDEIKKYYFDYLKIGVSCVENKSLETVTDDDVELFIDKIAENYNGYCFDEFCENKVFSTYSVNNFLQDIVQKRKVVFGDYWYDVGGIPSILKNYMESHDIDLKKFLSSEIEVNYDDFMNPTSLLDINENVLMYQTGYLTLKSEINRPFRIKLGTANKEVSSALSSLLCEKFFNSDAVSAYFDAGEVLKKGSADDIISHLNSVLVSIPYDKYPVENEPILRALILMYLTGLKLDVRAEQENSKGRSDILVNFDTRRVILELKFSETGRDVDSLLKDAVSQIKSREYGFENLGDRELLQIACVFDASKDKRKITLFCVVGR
ncbi:AAA family ATPase [Succinivibrio dextrinosolvens]|uniref:AAA family ATPase n=1 Tax=Succinivibrio dextrinosolvens TaxID=83771 RepID=UPI00192150CD|nr:AAA family ATPase [Succinivibrio dextrinosolvens]